MDRQRLDIQPKLVYSQNGDPAILRDAVRHPYESLQAVDISSRLFSQVMGRRRARISSASRAKALTFVAGRQQTLDPVDARLVSPIEVT